MNKEKISLRDYFAAKALTGLLASEHEGFKFVLTKDAVKAAYGYADAMIAKRDK